ncbi:MAG TPA: adenylyl-sulfate kinase [Candidatus Saccharimonadales bacterium]
MTERQHGNYELPGMCAWFTGLSGAGKTTTAEMLQKAIEAEGRRVTLLDGDVVRQHLSEGLGFSRQDRDTNVLRIGWVASQIVYHGGIAICSLISPYRDTRARVRELFDEGSFLEIHVATPLEVCEERDPKGHYRRVRGGELKGFTGVDDAYESPLAPEITLNTTELSVAENVDLIMQRIVANGLIRRPSA